MSRERKPLADTFTEAFHKHLDECSQCKNNPFNLCQIGALLLGSTSTARQIDNHNQPHPFEAFEQGRRP